MGTHGTFALENVGLQEHFLYGPSRLLRKTYQAWFWGRETKVSGIYNKLRARNRGCGKGNELS